MAKQFRDIIIIDEDLCDGCGDCIGSCAEGALEIVDGKARLKQEKFCDGAGACLGHCPTGALTIERREVEAYDEVAVQKNLVQMRTVPGDAALKPLYQGCPGSASRQFGPPEHTEKPGAELPAAGALASELRQWPVQLTLVAPNAPYFQNADIVITADCVPFAYADYHRDFLKDKSVVVGCPKLDNLGAYVEKLTELFSASKPRSVEVLLMEVPCCSGLGQAVQIARDRCGGQFPVKTTIISIRGEILGSRES